MKKQQGVIPSPYRFRWVLWRRNGAKITLSDKGGFESDRVLAGSEIRTKAKEAAGLKDVPTRWLQVPLKNRYLLHSGHIIQPSGSNDANWEWELLVRQLLQGEPL